MKHIQWEVAEKIDHSRLWDFYFPALRTCVLDIETTGLDRRRNHFILGGLLDVQTRQMHQVFAEDTAQEPEALADFMELAAQFDVIITYNGRHFDLPFLQERARRTGLGICAGGYDLDLYQVVNGHSPLRRLLPNLKQKTVETYMGLWTDRSDEISGAESVELYYHFTATGDPQARDKILLHNSDDVMQLTRLVKVMEKCDFHRAMYHMGFPVGTPGRRWQVNRIRSVSDRLCVEGTQGPKGMNYRSFALGDHPVQTDFDAKTGTFQMEIPVIRRSGIVAADLEAAGLPQKEFEKYPGFGSGFLVLEEGNGVKYRETNHFVKSMITRFEETIEWT